MEIKEILSYYFDQDTKRMDVSFRLTIDSEDEIRNDILKLEEAKEFGYDIVTEEDNFFDFDEEENDEDFDDFVTVDEDILLSYLNEYYIVYPDKLPKSELI
jgi:hypothetical protein